MILVVLKCVVQFEYLFHMFPVLYSNLGLNKHFHMICIQNQLSQALGFTVPAKDIWDHLYSLYDIDALDDVEVVPFQLDEKEFKLPEDFKVAKKSLKKEPTHTPEQPPDKDGKNLYRRFVANNNQPALTIDLTL